MQPSILGSTPASAPPRRPRAVASASPSALAPRSTSAMATEARTPARLKTRYLEEIRPALMERFGYSTIMQVPRIEKITVNMGVGEAKQDSRMLEAATEQLATLAGQKPSVRRARKSIAAFKLRE